MYTEIICCPAMCTQRCIKITAAAHSPPTSTSRRSRWRATAAGAAAPLPAPPAAAPAHRAAQTAAEKEAATGGDREACEQGGRRNALTCTYACAILDAVRSFPSCSGSSIPA